MSQPLCECHEFRSVKIVGCQILRCEAMSLQNDMWSAIMEETTWLVCRQWFLSCYVGFCLRQKFPAARGNSYLARISPKSANPPGQIGLRQKFLPQVLLGIHVIYMYIHTYIAYIHILYR